MKILLVNDYGTPTGGAEIQFLGLRTELRKRGHDARLFTSCAQPMLHHNAADYTCFGTTSRLRTLLQTANPWAWRRLRQVLRSFRPDVVHVKLWLTQLSPLILPLLRAIPSLYHVVWYRPVCPTGTKLWPDGTACRVSPGIVCYRQQCLPLRDWPPLMLQMHLWRRWQDAFDLIVANSAATRQKLLAEGIAPVEVIWNGVTARPMRPVLPPQPLAVFAGRLVWEKGVDVLLTAFRQVVQHIPTARLLVVGDGPDAARLHTLVGQFGLTDAVTLAGRLPREQLEARFAQAWVQVVPSRWEEPFGIVAAEAAMRGTAVIASDSGGLAEIVCAGQMGYLVSPGDPRALAESLTSLLQDRTLAESMGYAGHIRARAHFDEAHIADRFLTCYQTIRG